MNNNAHHQCYLSNSFGLVRAIASVASVVVVVVVFLSSP